MRAESLLVGVPDCTVVRRLRRPQFQPIGQREVRQFVQLRTHHGEEVALGPVTGLLQQGCARRLALRHVGMVGMGARLGIGPRHVALAGFHPGMQGSADATPAPLGAITPSCAYRCSPSACA